MTVEMEVKQKQLKRKGKKGKKLSGPREEEYPVGGSYHRTELGGGGTAVSA